MRPFHSLCTVVQRPTSFLPMLIYRAFPLSLPPILQTASNRWAIRLRWCHHLCAFIASSQPNCVPELSAFQSDGWAMEKWVNGCWGFIWRMFFTAGDLFFVEYIPLKGGELSEIMLIFAKYRRVFWSDVPYM